MILGFEFCGKWLAFSSMGGLCCQEMQVNEGSCLLQIASGGGIYVSVKEIREKLGMSRGEFSEKFKVSKRTLECWEYETRTPPPHVVFMLMQILELEEQVRTLTEENCALKKKRRRHSKPKEDTV